MRVRCSDDDRRAAPCRAGADEGGGSAAGVEPPSPNRGSGTYAGAAGAAGAAGVAVKKSGWLTLERSTRRSDDLITPVQPALPRGHPGPQDGDMSLHDVSLTTLDGRPTTLGEYAGKVLLIVNVASKCGFTPQYEGLQALYETYADQGFAILGFPCNQFLFQEPGDADQIQSFCSTTYGVTFPLFEKLKVRGRGQHPLYKELVTTKDAGGKAGAVKWNFEKFLIGRDGAIVGRFRTKVTPNDPQLVAAIEAALGVTAEPYPADETIRTESTI
jgi:glutathione peroxidase